MPRIRSGDGLPRLRSPRHLGTDGGQHAAGPGRCDMRLVEIWLDDSSQRRRRIGIAAELVPFGRRADQRCGGDRGNQRFLGREVSVEPTMRQAGFVHDRIDSDPVDTMLAEQGSGPLEDSLPCFRLPMAGFAHLRLPSCMTIIILLLDYHMTRVMLKRNPLGSPSSWGRRPLPAFCQAGYITPG